MSSLCKSTPHVPMAMFSGTPMKPLNQRSMYSGTTMKPLNQRCPTDQVVLRLPVLSQRLRPLQLLHCRAITNSPPSMAAMELPEIKDPQSEKISNNLMVSLMEANKNVSSNKNFISSPLGIDMLLSMVAAGSTGETREQLLNFLGSENLETINMKASKIMEIISTSIDKIKSNEPTVSFVNGAWVDQQHSIQPSYSKLLKDTYRAEAKAVDFEKVEEVCEEVNLWASRSTQGLIDKILTPQHLSKDSMLVLANALFFKADWQHQFTNVKKKNFHLLNKETVEAPLMTLREFDKLEGASFDGFKLMKIPYKTVEDGREFAMYIFLPDAKDGLVGLMQRFCKDSSFLDQKFHLEEDVLSEFWIPKFKFSHTFTASGTLKKLGLDRMFMHVRELTEIVDLISSDEMLYLSEILQKSYIEVDESGTKAASVTTGILGNIKSAWQPERHRERFKFVADHPFMFLIREETSGATFFVGAILNPLLG